METAGSHWKVREGQSRAVDDKTLYMNELFFFHTATSSSLCMIIRSPVYNRIDRMKIYLKSPFRAIFFFKEENGLKRERNKTLKR